MFGISENGTGEPTNTSKSKLGESYKFPLFLEAKIIGKKSSDCIVTKSEIEFVAAIDPPWIVSLSLYLNGSFLVR